MLLWMIPGKCRSIGTRWFEALLGSLLQSVIITACVGGVMVLSGIFNNALSTYGFFMVGLLNLAVFGAALKVRGMFENLTGMSSISGASGAGGMGGYMAMRALGSVGRGVGKVTGAAAGAGAGAARLAGKAAMHGSGGFMNPGGKLPALQSANPLSRLRSHFHVPTNPPREPGRVTPYEPKALPPGSIPSSEPKVPAGLGAGRTTPMHRGERSLPAAGSRGGAHSTSDGWPALRPTVTELPNPRPSRLALPAAASSTTSVSPAAARAPGQPQRRMFAAPTSEPGPVPSAQRVPPPPPPRRPSVVVYGQGQNIGATTRRALLPPKPKPTAAPTQPPMAGAKRG